MTNIKIKMKQHILKFVALSVVLINTIFPFGAYDIKEKENSSSKWYSVTQPKPRILRYAKPFEMDNSLTGTGFELKDTAYRALCLLIPCQTGCCEGPIMEMQCGKAENCMEYQKYLDLRTLKYVMLYGWLSLIAISIFS